jgi:hypothetical protein
MCLCFHKESICQSYDCAVKIYNTMSSVVRFEKTTFSSALKNALIYYNAGVVAVNVEVAKVAPGIYI